MSVVNRPSVTFLVGRVDKISYIRTRGRVTVAKQDMQWVCVSTPDSINN